MEIKEIKEFQKRMMEEIPECDEKIRLSMDCDVLMEVLHEKKKAKKN